MAKDKNEKDDKPKKKRTPLPTKPKVRRLYKEPSTVPPLDEAVIARKQEELRAAAATPPLTPTPPPPPRPTRQPLVLKPEAETDPDVKTEAAPTTTPNTAQGHDGGDEIVVATPAPAPSQEPTPAPAVHQMEVDEEESEDDGNGSLDREGGEPTHSEQVPQLRPMQYGGQPAGMDGFGTDAMWDGTMYTGPDLAASMAGRSPAKHLQEGGDEEEEEDDSVVDSDTGRAPTRSASPPPPRNPPPSATPSRFSRRRHVEPATYRSIRPHSISIGHEFLTRAAPADFSRPPPAPPSAYYESGSSSGGAQGFSRRTSVAPTYTPTSPTSHGSHSPTNFSPTSPPPRDRGMGRHARNASMHSSYGSISQASTPGYNTTPISPGYTSSNTDIYGSGITSSRPSPHVVHTPLFYPRRAGEVAQGTATPNASIPTFRSPNYEQTPQGPAGYSAARVPPHEYMGSLHVQVTYQGDASAPYHHTHQNPSFGQDVSHAASQARRMYGDGQSTTTQAPGPVHGTSTGAGALYGPNYALSEQPNYEPGGGGGHGSAYTLVTGSGHPHYQVHQTSPAGVYSGHQGWGGGGRGEGQRTAFGYQDGQGAQGGRGGYNPGESMSWKQGGGGGARVEEDAEGEASHQPWG